MRGLCLLAFVLAYGCGKDDGGGGGGSSTLDVKSLTAFMGPCSKGICPLYLKAVFTSEADLPEEKVFIFDTALGDTAPAVCEANSALAGRTGAWTAQAPQGFAFAIRGCVRDNDTGEVSPGATTTVTSP